MKVPFGGCIEVSEYLIKRSRLRTMKITNELLDYYGDTFQFSEHKNQGWTFVQYLTLMIESQLSNTAKRSNVKC